MSAAKVELGRRLFFEPRLSVTGQYTCASCHQPAHAFTDTLAHGVGALGDKVLRSTPSLINVVYLPSYTWADSKTHTLEAQMRRPLLGTHPIELGFQSRSAAVLAEFRDEPQYADSFRAAFPEELNPVTVETIIKAIAAFERTLISAHSPFDRYLYADEQTALSPAAVRGMQLFFSPRTGCAGCHSGPNFSGPIVYEGREKVRALFMNTKLYDIDGRGGYPKSDRGLSKVTGASTDDGKFRVPTLRNIALTAPYMHDGSIATLEAVIDHYARGGRASRDDRSATGSLRSFAISAEERRDLAEFLRSLTDDRFARPAGTSTPLAVRAE